MHRPLYSMRAVLKGHLLHSPHPPTPHSNFPSFNKKWYFPRWRQINIFISHWVNYDIVNFPGCCWCSLMWIITPHGALLHISYFVLSGWPLAFKSLENSISHRRACLNSYLLWFFNLVTTGYLLKTQCSWMFSMLWWLVRQWKEGELLIVFPQSWTDQWLVKNFFQVWEANKETWSGLQPH